MRRSIRILAFGLGSALVFHARMAAAGLDIRPVHPGFQAAAGSSVLIEAVIENSSDAVVFLNSVSADLTDAFAGADLFDEFNASAPDSLLPGENWEGPIIRLTLALDAPVSTTHQITVQFTGGVHLYDEANLAEFTFALNDSTVPVSVPTDAAPARSGTLMASPNPSRGNSLIAFDLPSPQWVDVQVYDVRGAAVRSLARGLRDAGPQAIVWDGRNDSGRAVAPGVYFVKLQTVAGARKTKVVRIR
jgi:hypothetical protein